LQVFAAVDEGELEGGGDGGGVVVRVEGVGFPLSDVVVVFAQVGQDVGEDVAEEIWDRGVVDLKDELVEQGGGGSHNETRLVESSNAGAGAGDDAGGEVGAEVFCWGEAVDYGVPGSHFEWVEFENGGVEGDDLGAWSSAVRYKEGEGNGSIAEVIG